MSLRYKVSSAYRNESFSIRKYLELFCDVSPQPAFRQFFKYSNRQIFLNNCSELLEGSEMEEEGGVAIFFK